MIEPVGGAVSDAARKALAWEGRLVLVGFASGSFPEVRTNSVLLRNYSVVGLHLGPYQEHRPDVTAAAFRDLVELYQAGSIKPLISAVHSLE